MFDYRRVFLLHLFYNRCSSCRVNLWAILGTSEAKQNKGSSVLCLFCWLHCKRLAFLWCYCLILCVGFWIEMIQLPSCDQLYKEMLSSTDFHVSARYTNVLDVFQLNVSFFPSPSCIIENKDQCSSLRSSSLQYTYIIMCMYIYIYMYVCICMLIQLWMCFVVQCLFPYLRWRFPRFSQSCWSTPILIQPTQWMDWDTKPYKTI